MDNLTLQGALRALDPEVGHHPFLHDRTRQGKWDYRLNQDLRSCVDLACLGQLVQNVVLFDRIGFSGNLMDSWYPPSQHRVRSPQWWDGITAERVDPLGLPVEFDGPADVLAVVDSADEDGWRAAPVVGPTSSGSPSPGRTWCRSSAPWRTSPATSPRRSTTRRSRTGCPSPARRTRCARRSRCSGRSGPTTASRRTRAACRRRWSTCGRAGRARSTRCRRTATRCRACTSTCGCRSSRPPCSPRWTRRPTVVEAALRLRDAPPARRLRGWFTELRARVRDGDIGVGEVQDLVEGLNSAVDRWWRDDPPGGHEVQVTAGINIGVLSAQVDTKRAVGGRTRPPRSLRFVQDLAQVSDATPRLAPLVSRVFGPERARAWNAGQATFGAITGIGRSSTLLTPTRQARP